MSENLNDKILLSKLHEQAALLAQAAEVFKCIAKELGVAVPPSLLEARCNDVEHIERDTQTIKSDIDAHTSTVDLAVEQNRQIRSASDAQTSTIDLGGGKSPASPPIPRYASALRTPHSRDKKTEPASQGSISRGHRVTPTRTADRASPALTAPLLSSEKETQPLDSIPRRSSMLATSTPHKSATNSRKHDMPLSDPAKASSRSTAANKSPRLTATATTRLKPAPPPPPPLGASPTARPSVADTQIAEDEENVPYLRQRDPAALTPRKLSEETTDAPSSSPAKAPTSLKPSPIVSSTRASAVGAAVAHNSNTTAARRMPLNVNGNAAVSGMIRSKLFQNKTPVASVPAVGETMSSAGTEKPSVKPGGGAARRVAAYRTAPAGLSGTAPPGLVGGPTASLLTTTTVATTMTTAPVKSRASPAAAASRDGFARTETIADAAKKKPAVGGGAARVKVY